MRPSAANPAVLEVSFEGGETVSACCVVNADGALDGKALFVFACAALIACPHRWGGINVKDSCGCERTVTKLRTLSADVAFAASARAPPAVARDLVLARLRVHRVRHADAAQRGEVLDRQQVAHGAGRIICSYPASAVARAKRSRTH